MPRALPEWQLSCSNDIASAVSPLVASKTKKCEQKTGKIDHSFFSNSRFLTTALALLASNVVRRDCECEGDMLWTLFVVLLVLWLLGVVSSYTMGGFIHLLLVLAVIALVFQLITGRRAAV